MDKIEFGFTSWIVEIVNDCSLFPRIRLRARAKRNENMIFSADHIAQIKARTKTQTRRKSPAYRVGRTYAIQPGRKKRIPDGCILITRKREEKYLDGGISVFDALAEGGYTPGQYETLFKNMYPGWIVRYAYTFEFIPSEQYRSTKL